jgi:TRAP transporter TAXI family solute receptor
MFDCARSARASTARGFIKEVLATFAFVLIAFASLPAWSAEPKDIRWGTGPVGSSGGKALVVLANVLNKEIPEYRISVLPTPGAVTTVKGFATGEFDGTYASDVAFREFATDSGRFKGFKAMVKRTPVQSFWCYTLDVGLAIKRANKDKFKSWNDLTGKEVYTGPLPFDTRKHLENALAALGVHHIYKQVDLSTAGSQLDSGSIDAMILYVSGGKTPAPWISEASLAVDWTPLNPSPQEIAELKAKHFQVIEVDPTNFNKKEAPGSKLALLPFFWGFDLGLNVPTDDMYRMLKVIEQHADELAQLDPDFAEIGGGKMAAFQKTALESTWDLVPIHPGLRKYLDEKGMWESKWDSNIAK